MSDAENENVHSQNCSANSSLVIVESDSQNSSSTDSSLEIVGDIPTKTNTVKSKRSRIQYSKEEFLKFKQAVVSQTRHAILSTEYINDQGLFSPNEMIRVLWKRAGLEDTKKRNVNKPISVINRFRSHNFSIPQPLPYCRPLSPGQMAILESIQYRKLEGAKLPIKVSVDEFMRIFSSRNAFAYSHRQLEENYQHLLRPEYAQTAFQTNGSRFGFSDNVGNSRALPVFRPAAQRTFGFVPVASQNSDQANCRHFNSMILSQFSARHVPFGHAMSQGMARPLHRFNSSNRFSLSSYDSFGFPWKSVRNEGLPSPRFVLPSMSGPRFMDSSQLPNMQK
uniref:Uncharacterized protein n=1 Tax=Acrobeloides nanus TaxID=290746 RepID=A0A914BVL1_9BILA